MSRLPCQCCARALVAMPDGTSRAHNRKSKAGSRCPGSGYRLARWPEGQELVHHSSGTWVVDTDLGGAFGDYLIRCIAGPENGRQLVAHGEYMHRHGWIPCPPDLMAALERSLSGVRR